MSTPTEWAEFPKADEPAPILSSCPICDVEIHIHLGPPVEICDLARAEPIAKLELPKDSSGDHVLMCLECAHDSQVVVRAGFAFHTEDFRAAKEIAEEEVGEPDRELIVDLRRRGAEPEEILSALKATAGGRTPTSEDWDLYAQYRDALLLKHFEKATEARTRAVRETRKLERRQRVGLRVVRADGEQPEKCPPF